LDNQHYCRHCGRVNSKEKTCVHEKKISIKEAIIWMIVFVNLPLALFLVYYTKASILWLGNLSLSILFLLLVLFNKLLNKPYLAMVFGCHQRTDRSPKFLQHVLPLCFRCLGIFLGTFLMLILSYHYEGLLWTMLLSLPLVIDGLLQKYTKYQSNTFKRFFSGLLFSPTLVIFFSYLHYLYLMLILWMGQVIA
jgi:uncharacterized membrane protein